MIKGVGVFILGNGRVSGNAHLPKFIQALAGQKVVPAGITVPESGSNKSIMVTLTGGNGLSHDVLIGCFVEHPPVETLRQQAVSV